MTTDISLTSGLTRTVYISSSCVGRYGGLEDLKIETRLRGGRVESVKGECVI
jgi:hypothetical protein